MTTPAPPSWASYTLGCLAPGTLVIVQNSSEYPDWPARVLSMDDVKDEKLLPSAQIAALDRNVAEDRQDQAVVLFIGEDSVNVMPLHKLELLSIDEPLTGGSTSLTARELFWVNSVREQKERGLEYSDEVRQRVGNAFDEARDYAKETGLEMKGLCVLGEHDGCFPKHGVMEVGTLVFSDFLLSEEGISFWPCWVTSLAPGTFQSLFGKADDGKSEVVKLFNDVPNSDEEAADAFKPLLTGLLALSPVVLPKAGKEAEWKAFYYHLACEKAKEKQRIHPAQRQPHWAKTFDEGYVETAMSRKAWKEFETALDLVLASGRQGKLVMSGGRVGAPVGVGGVSADGDGDRLATTCTDRVKMDGNNGASARGGLPVSVGPAGDVDVVDLITPPSSPVRVPQSGTGLERQGDVFGGTAGRSLRIGGSGPNAVGMYCCLSDQGNAIGGQSVVQATPDDARIVQFAPAPVRNGGADTVLRDGDVSKLAIPARRAPSKRNRKGRSRLFGSTRRKSAPVEVLVRPVEPVSPAARPSRENGAVVGKSRRKYLSAGDGEGESGLPLMDKVVVGTGPHPKPAALRNARLIDPSRSDLEPYLSLVCLAIWRQLAKAREYAGINPRQAVAADVLFEYVNVYWDTFCWNRDDRGPICQRKLLRSLREAKTGTKPTFTETTRARGKFYQLREDLYDTIEVMDITFLCSTSISFQQRLLGTRKRSAADLDTTSNIFSPAKAVRTSARLNPKAAAIEKDSLGSRPFTVHDRRDIRAGQVLPHKKPKQSEVTPAAKQPSALGLPKSASAQIRRGDGARYASRRIKMSSGQVGVSSEHSGRGVKAREGETKSADTKCEAHPNRGRSQESKPSETIDLISDDEDGGGAVILATSRGGGGANENDDDITPLARMEMAEALRRGGKRTSGERATETRNRLPCPSATGRAPTDPPAVGPGIAPGHGKIASAFASTPEGTELSAPASVSPPAEVPSAALGLLSVATAAPTTTAATAAVPTGPSSGLARLEVEISIDILPEGHRRVSISGGSTAQQVATVRALMDQGAL